MIFLFAPMNKDESKLSGLGRRTPAGERLRYACVGLTADHGVFSRWRLPRPKTLARVDAAAYPHYTVPHDKPRREFCDVRPVVGWSGRRTLGD
jgi:hypothetical protein